MINIIVVSEIRIYCEGLSQILAGIDRVNVICSCSNSENALSLIEAHVPDVVLLDMTMAWSRNLAQHIAELEDSVKIVALAVPYDEANILQCAEPGITGYVPREASVDELIDAVVGAAKGEC
ncbi:MAG: response regulator transcription factor, partial [Gammaproteobacteria bacterium]|nr:response regulator transcription factor [Gammaproteobacteria bacterium]